VKLVPPAARAAGIDAVMTAVYEAALDPSRRPAAAKALRELAQRLTPSGIDRRNGTVLMVLHAMVDDLDSAYAAANHALDFYASAGSIGYVWQSLWMPMMANFRRDVRFDALAARVHLPEYWAVHGPPESCELAGSEIRCH
jgi:hypothetical protein